MPISPDDFDLNDAPEDGPSSNSSTGSKSLTPPIPVAPQNAAPAAGAPQRAAPAGLQPVTPRVGAGQIVTGILLLVLLVWLVSLAVRPRVETNPDARSQGEPASPTTAENATEIANREREIEEARIAAAAERTRVEQGLQGEWADGSSRLTITRDGTAYSAVYRFPDSGPFSRGEAHQTMRGELLADNALKLTNIYHGKLANPLDYFSGDFDGVTWISLSADGTSVTAKLADGRTRAMTRVAGGDGGLAAAEVGTAVQEQIRADVPTIAELRTTAGEIRIRFFPDKAPNHVRNFIALAQAGFYNGTRFHRVIPGFMIQGGDPNTISGDRSTWGMGGSRETLAAEFNDVPHKRGIVSMARAQDPNGASSQFFICVAEARSLDRKYTVFGEVVDGMEVVDTIVRAPRDRSDRPNAPTTIEGITIRDAKDHSAVTDTSTGQENHVSERRTERAGEVSTIGSTTAHDELPSGTEATTLAQERRTTSAGVDAGTVASSTMKGSSPAMHVAPSARESTERSTPNDDSVGSLSAVGQWRGNVKQFLAPRYSVVLSLAHGKIGTYVGSIEYPEVNCSGDLTLLDTAPGQVRISEVITSGRCVSGGTIVISNIRSNTAEWAWYNKNGRRQATSRITRLGSGERR